jgi:hypothetical protein
MKKSLIIALCLVVGFGLIFVAGCGKKTAEKTIEKSIEESTNGQADVDLDEGSVKVNTNAGSFVVGEEVSLPSGFPSDVHVIDGTIKSAVTIKENESYTITVETSKSIAQAKSDYETELKADGWTVSASVDLTNVSSLSAEKGNRTVSVVISESEGKTMVMIGTATKSE